MNSQLPTSIKMNNLTRTFLALLGLSVVVIPVLLWLIFSGNRKTNLNLQGGENYQISPSIFPTSTASSTFDEFDLSTHSASPSGR